MPAKAYLRILQGGIIASLFIIFFVFADLLFPYITSKQLPFNILMEVLFVVWLVFIMRYPEYRPKRNYISYGLVAYFLAILASCAVSVDFNLSFWGDAERMLGVFHISHFLIFYYILITVFKTRTDWKILLLFSIVIASIVSLIGLTGENNYATIGNTSYVSGYLIFNLYFVVLLFFRSQGAWRWFYLVPLILMLLEFKNMRTSGAIIGLAASILLLFLLLGLSHVNKKIRRASLVIFVVAVIAVVGIFSQYRSNWFQNSFLKNLTAQKSTFQTRLISWRGAAADFHNHPILGTGFGNYAIIFDKYFDSKFFNYVKDETYFDRAHNNLIDIASTTGAVGLITYLSIFAAALYYLWEEFKKNGRRSGGDEAGRKNLEIIIIVALLTAYFIQNLAVFDSFVTYLGIMILLGFIYWLIQERKNETEEEPEKKYRLTLKTQNKEITVLVILLIAVYIFTIQYNVKPWRSFSKVIDGYTKILSGNVMDGIAVYQQTLTGLPLERDSRVTLINLTINSSDVFTNLKSAEARSLIDYVISLAKKNVSENEYDSLMQMQYAQALDTAARLNINDLRLFNYYSGQALVAIDRSIEASPQRIPIYFTKAQIQLGRGENEAAIDTLKYAVSLNTDYNATYCRLAQFYLFLKEEQDLSATLNACLDKGGAEEINSPTVLKNFINFYAGQKDYGRALILTERLANIYNNEPDIWFNLAKLYAATGNKEKALETADKAVALDPKYKEQLPDLNKILQAVPSATGLNATTSGAK
ncbi:MAG: O-antigen ligase family protein [Patescibacteria group bacterium]